LSAPPAGSSPAPFAPSTSAIFANPQKHCEKLPRHDGWGRPRRRPGAGSRRIREAQHPRTSFVAGIADLNRNPFAPM
jgi:hypothetical protein